MKKESAKRPAIVLGASTPALGIVQSLGLKGVPCWACAPGRELSTWSRYANYWWIPDPRDDEAGMVERVAELSAKLDRIPVLIPTVDQYAQAIARHPTGTNTTVTSQFRSGMRQPIGDLDGYDDGWFLLRD